jgi:hypothetical protein
MRVGKCSTRILLLYAFALVLLPAAAMAQEVTDTTRLPAELLTARRGWSAAITGRDANAAGAFVADSAVAEFGEERFVGKASFVRDFLGAQFQGLSSIRFGPGKIVRNGSNYDETTTYFVMPTDGSGEQSGQSMVTWRRYGTAWRVAKLTVLPGGQRP